MMNETSQESTRRWVLVLTSLASFMVALDALVVTTALSQIQHSLGSSIEELGWTVNAYTLSFAVLLLTGAALGDRFGRRRIFVAGLGLFTLASATCALAPTIGWLIAARAIQGCGAALVMPLAVTQLSVNFPAARRGRALGIYSGITGLAVLAGPVIGGAIVWGIAWQWIFWLNVPIGLLLIPLILRRIPESYGVRTPLDIGGLLLVTGATFGVVWGLVRGSRSGWGAPETVIVLVGGLLLAGAFVLWEGRTAAPMLPLSLFRSRTFSAGNAASFFFFASLYGSSFFLAQFLQVGLGYGPLGAGIRMLPWTVILFASAPLAGMLINRVGERTLIASGLLLQGVAMLWIGLIARADLAYVALIVPLIIAGFGALVIPSSQNAVVSSVAITEIGKASGAFSMIRQLGAAFGVALLTAVFARSGSFASAQAFSDGFAPAMICSALLSLAGCVAALWLPSLRQRAVGQAIVAAESGD